MLSVAEHKGTNFTIVRGAESSVGNALRAIGFGGSAIIITVSTPEPLVIVSSNNNDGAGDGSGAITIKVTAGISMPEGEIERFVFGVGLEGTTPVPLDYEATDILRLHVIETGSANSNIGTISIKTALTDTVLRTIPATVGTSQSSLVTVTRRSKIKQLNVYTDATTTSNVPELYEIVVRINEEQDSGDFSATASGNILATFYAKPGQNIFEMFDAVSEGTQLWVTAKNVTNSNVNAVSTEMILYGF